MTKEQLSEIKLYIANQIEKANRKLHDPRLSEDDTLTTAIKFGIYREIQLLLNGELILNEDCTKSVPA